MGSIKKQNFSALAAGTVGDSRSQLDFAFFRAIFDSVRIGIAVLDRQSETIEINPALHDMIRGSGIELAFQQVFVAGHATVAALFEGPAFTDSFEYCIPATEVEADRWLHITASCVFDLFDRPSHLVCMVEDCTAKHRHEAALMQAEARYRNIFENALEGIFQTSTDGHYLSANPALARIYGYEGPDDLMNGITDIANQLYVDPRRREEFMATLASRGEVEDFVSQIRRRDGTVIWISENCRAVRNPQGELCFYEGTVENITDRKVAEDQLLHDALHDTLTGLPNRALFMDRLSHAMERRKRHDVNYAVLFIDCDRFKLINDSLGHNAGDLVLIELSQRIGFVLRASDTLARLGGDEFVILAEELDGGFDAQSVASRIHDSLAPPFRLAGQDYYISTSIGIAHGTPDYANPGDLLRDADTAMYAAKNAGRDRAMVFEPGMHNSAVIQLQIANDLRRAVHKDDEISVAFQPIYRMDRNTLAGFEALARWRHPSGEMIGPDTFIPVAEDTGLIHILGRKVLAMAATQVAQWKKQRLLPRNFFLSVNLSPAQLHRADIVTDVADTVMAAGLSPSVIRLEITESSIILNPAAAKTKLDALKAHGFSLAIDDFGTGYSSLAQLHRFPIDTLKIDRSFIALMLQGGEHMEVVKTILMLGRNLGMSLVAEGVETPQHHWVLRGLKCTYGQGWHYARPMPADQAEVLLRADKA